METRLAHINNKIVCHLWRPGNHGHFRDGRPVGFASPAFTGFAIIGYFLLTKVYDVYSGLCFTDLLTTNLLSGLLALFSLILISLKATTQITNMPDNFELPGMSYLNDGVEYRFKAEMSA